MTATLTRTPEKVECSKDCSISEKITCDLNSRDVEEIHFNSLHEINDKELLGYYADDTFYDRLITSDCDVFVEGEKVLSFRKKLFPLLKDKDQSAWQYFRWAAKDMYSDSRGVVAGKEPNTDLDVRVSTGVLNFFKAAMAGKVSTSEDALGIVSRSPDASKFHARVGNVKTDFPTIKDSLEPIEKELRSKKFSVWEREEKKKDRGAILQEWFPTWLKDVWEPATDKVKVSKVAFDRYISKQIRANKCYSNILGAMDRSARVPYCRLTMSTQKDPVSFQSFKSVYQAACVALRLTIPQRWEALYRRFSEVAEPTYNLFGTCFTTLTMNWNFRTAFHRDANNCEGGIAVLTAMTQGEYDGHYLVFPQIRLAFDLRDGDFLAGDNQNLLHANTAMIPKTPDAERVSFVFYSRERMTIMEDIGCETCRKDFMVYAKDNLSSTHGTGHAGWNGIWENMWISPEWQEFKANKGLERCGNTNWHGK
ncbi:putative SNF2 DNA repair protein [Synechococcus phage S-CBWM1]|uniref:Putative SNF2 DNA repair protein n=1 Tax=Synechococcus phage S-CBWM1 TaxID=2053653 RepID=A0A3G1L3A4_9CAUD|nr:putative SNF2 DNA repair protein [Synechococcus phage S-CBWM1]ATW62692.1 putative SNF2 DNA repair protein [Synechococcus phage S-CBWM1]